MTLGQHWTTSGHHCVANIMMIRLPSCFYSSLRFLLWTLTKWMLHEFVATVHHIENHIGATLGQHWATLRARLHKSYLIFVNASQLSLMRQDPEKCLTKNGIIDAVEILAPSRSNNVAIIGARICKHIRATLVPHKIHMGQHSAAGTHNSELLDLRPILADQVCFRRIPKIAPDKNEIINAVEIWACNVGSH